MSTPRRCFRKLKRPSTASVAEVRMIVSNGSNRRSRKQGAHVDRRRRDEHALVAAFEPVDVVPFARFEQEFQFAAQFHPAARDVQQFLGLCGERGDFRFQAFQRVHQGVVGLAVLFEESGALRLVERKAALARRERLEKAARALAHPRDLLLQSRAAGLRYARGNFGVARQLIETIIGNLPAEDNRWRHPRSRALRRKSRRRIREARCRSRPA